MAGQENPWAFPRPKEFQYGMTLRDWFAGQALAGLMANEGWSSGVADVAYSLADDMLAARPAQTGADHG